MNSSFLSRSYYLQDLLRKNVKPQFITASCSQRNPIHHQPPPPQQQQQHRLYHSILSRDYGINIQSYPFNRHHDHTACGSITISSAVHRSFSDNQSSSTNHHHHHHQSQEDNPNDPKSEETPKANNEDSTTTTDTSASSPPPETSEMEKLQAELKEMKDQLLRSLAEQENIRRIAQRDVENARNFAVSSFAKSLLDTSDNLTRAMEAVPVEYRQDNRDHPVLATLYEGIRMTDDGLTKAFTKNGLKKFGERGDKFDPNLHDALFEYPDESLEPGTVGQVMKVGFTLNNRVIRPAEVGVVKKS